jgi:hypothetical protein
MYQYNFHKSKNSYGCLKYLLVSKNHRFTNDNIIVKISNIYTIDLIEYLKLMKQIIALMIGRKFVQDERAIL